MRQRYAAILLAGLCMPGCAMNVPAPPMIVVSNQPTVGSRERGYVSCAMALYRAYPRERRLMLHQRYQAAYLEDRKLMLYRLSGYLDERGGRRKVTFECLTTRGHRATVRDLTLISSQQVDG